MPGETFTAYSEVGYNKDEAVSTEAQNLTTEQKGQARDNIDVFSKAEVNAAIAQSTATLLKSKTVTISNSVAGASWSQTSRKIGTATGLFAIPASRIRALQIRSAGVNPASICLMSLFGDDVYVAATQDTTLSTDILIDICYE